MALIIDTGGGISIRALSPADSALVARGWALLSPESRYRRFGRVVVDPADALGWVSQLGGRGHVAVGACEPVSGSPVGVARYVRLAGGAAEVAVTVIDGWQGRGVGTLLLAELVGVAAADGISELRASVLFGNRPAMRLMRGIGGTRVGGGGATVDYAAPIGLSRRSCSPTGAPARSRACMR